MCTSLWRWAGAWGRLPKEATQVLRSAAERAVAGKIQVGRSRALAWARMGPRSDPEFAVDCCALRRATCRARRGRAHLQPIP
eukprot:13596048-Alexandrium_andersonii.AAC.1